MKSILKILSSTSQNAAFCITDQTKGSTPRKVGTKMVVYDDGSTMSIASKRELEEVDMPLGINIKANGPEEIAISILAILTAIKNG